MKTTKYSNMSAIAVNKSLLKEYQTSYGRTVYLDKDSEFQIKLFNPNTFTVGAEIFINDKSLGETLIIRPGQIIWLERYFNEARKFRFDVYEVDAKVEAVKEAIKNNGDIRVKFYKERTPYYKRYGFGDVVVNHTYNINNTDTPASDPYRITCSDCNLSYDLHSADLSKLSYSSTPETFATANYADVKGLNISGDVFSIGPSSITTTYNNTGSTTRSANKLLRNEVKTENTTMETGRVEKGGYSDQRFSEVDIDLEYFSFATEEIKLLPKSQKPVFKEDLEKLYCPECGRKVKTKFKFCPFCGAKL